MTDEVIDMLLYKLDDLARDYDKYEQGLPTHSEDEMALMRRAVRDWLNEHTTDGDH